LKGGLELRVMDILLALVKLGMVALAAGLGAYFGCCRCLLHIVVLLAFASATRGRQTSAAEAAICERA
jgi:hypothetical protein